MNKYASYPLKRGLSWWCMIRLARDAKPKPVMDEDRKPKTFPTRGEAAEECLRQVISFMNGAELRGERFEECSSYRASVERKFFKDDRKVAAS